MHPSQDPSTLTPHCPLYRCSACPGRTTPLHPKHQYSPAPAPSPGLSGQSHVRVMLISDAPAAQTDIRYGEPLIGEAGRELDSIYLPALGLTRNQVYMTTAVKCLFDDGARAPWPSEVSACAQRNLWREICLVNPDLVIPLGSLASGLFGLKLNQDHGIAAYTEVSDGIGGQWAGFVLPTYHPNAGFTEDRGSQFITAIHYDMKSAGEFLKVLQETVDQYPDPDYREIQTPAQWWDYLGMGPDSDARYTDCAVDIETDTSLTRRRPPAWSAQFTVRPGSGVIVKRRHTETFATIHAWFNKPRHYRPRAIYHSYQADLNPAAELGFTTPRFTDTLQMAVILGLPSRGLKYLCRRYLGMPMVDFWDVVVPPSRLVTHAYVGEFVELYTQEHGYLHAMKTGKRKGESELRWKRYEVLDEASAIRAVHHSKGDASKWIKAQGPLNPHFLTVRECQPPGKAVFNKVNRLAKALDGISMDPEPEPEAGAGATVWSPPVEPEAETETGPAAGVLDDGADSTGIVDPWKRWDGWPKSDQEYVAGIVGRAFTYPSIVFCRPADAKQYAVRDTDGTYRLRPILARLFRFTRARRGR